MLLGSNQGKILAYRISDGLLDGNPNQVGGIDSAVTQLVTLNNIEDNEAFIMIIGNKELFIYIHNKRD